MTGQETEISIHPREDVCIERDDPGYPSALRDCADAPATMWVRGRLPVGRAVAVVGSRAASAAGRASARAIAKALVAGGYAVVSGGAMGIDTAAHRGALEAGGATVVVLGSGLERLYPPQNESLFTDVVAGGGALLSPFAAQEGPRRWHFPRRNRVIAGLSVAVVVAEASAKSGALGTAQAARAYGRLVLAVPGSPGAHQAIALGAVRVPAPEAVLDALEGRAMPSPARVAPADPLAARVLDAIGGGPRSVDEIARATGMDATAVSAALMDLELEGLAVRGAAGYVQS